MTTSRIPVLSEQDLSYAGRGNFHSSLFDVFEFNIRLKAYAVKDGDSRNKQYLYILKHL